FILSVEIVIIALSTVADADLSVQIVTVSVVAIIATIGVYGLVALIVRMDDFGLKLVEKSNNTGLVAKTGNALIKLLPVVIKTLYIFVLVALFLLSDEIFSHQVDYFHHLFNNLPAIVRQIIFALVMGTIAFLIVSLIKKTIGLVSKK